MNIRTGGFRALPLVLFAFWLAAGADAPLRGQEKEKDSIKALFDGIPADLRSKVRDNPVRCDRVNDWLKENVNGKGKTIDVRLGVNALSTSRSMDGTYIVRLSLAGAKGNVLEDNWRVYFNNQGLRVNVEGRDNFAFTGVSTAEAEKLVDLKQLVIQGKVLEAQLARTGAVRGFALGGVDDGSRALEGLIFVALEDVRVDGKKWTTYVLPFGAGKKKGGASPEQPKKGNKGQPAP